ncbi:ribonuclease H, partial [Trifolium pratense]
SKVLGSIVNLSQAAFVPGQHIHDHILLAYELIRGYSRKGGTPKCMLQLDLQKAYDTVDWHALQHILREVGLPNQFVRWIMLGVTSVSYKFNIHGKHTSFMKARRGLRQGDPISPLLFVVVMEYLHRTLQRLTKVPDFNFHSKCENLSIINLSFADDLLIFTRGDAKSVELVMSKLKDFSRSTGLYVNPSKCKVFYGGVEEHIKESIKNVTSFAEGSLPFRYLGVPLTSKKLSIHHYMPLVDRIVERIRTWSAKLLSHAGRLQLISSVTFAVANYWMQCLPLPKKNGIEPT